MLIGYMHYRKSPEKRGKAYAYAAAAKAEGAELLYFSPGAVNFEKRNITGYIYEKGRWEEVISRFPDVICNVIGFPSKRQDIIAKKLMKEIPFTSFSIGSKLTVFKNLQKYNEFMQNIPPTCQISSIEDFFSFAKTYEDIVIKPSSGHHGIDLLFIKKRNNLYEIQSEDETVILDYKKTSRFINERISKQLYIAQKYINCRTTSGQPYDFRLHVQKDIEGKWIITSIYPRISLSDSIVCNVSNKGCSTKLKTFLKTEFGEDFLAVNEQLEEFALRLAAHMDKIQKEQSSQELDELGIDVGLDRNRHMWIYEVNWRPGTPPVLNIDVFKHKIRYAIYLAAKKGVVN